MFNVLSSVPSPEPDTISWPSGENATARTQPEWPFSIRRSAPVAASHTRTVPSPEQDEVGRRGADLKGGASCHE